MEHKFKVLKQVRDGSVTIEEAAKLLNMRTRVVKQYLTIHGDNLRIIVPLIDKLLEPVNDKHDQAVLKEQLSELLGVSYRQVGRLIETADVKIPTPLAVVQRQKTRLNARSRLFMRTKTALQVIAGHITAATASKQAEVTPKHVYRMCGELLESEGLVFKDLKLVSKVRREELANKLEAEVLKA